MKKLILTLTVLVATFALAPVASANHTPDHQKPDQQGTCPPGQAKQGVYCEPDRRDPDGDGLSNETEAQLGTNPNDADSDDDGFNDRQDRCPTVAGPAGGCPQARGQEPSQSPPRGRVRPARVDVTPRRSRTKKTKTVRTSGVIVPPQGMSVADACTDDAVARIIVKARKQTVSQRAANVRDDCSFSSSVTFTNLKRLRGKALKVRAAYEGNDILEAITSDFLRPTKA